MRYEEHKLIFRCIKNFNLVVHSDRCIDDNDIVVNMWWRWEWLSKTLIFVKKIAFSWITLISGVNRANESSKKKRS